MSKSTKRYLILTCILKEGAKVHYPLPLNAVDTGLLKMDKDTMRDMVKRMSQTLTEFQKLNATGSLQNGSNPGF